MSAIHKTLLAVFFVVIMGALGGDCLAQGGNPPMKAIYGFSPQYPAFAGRQPERIAQALADWGVTAVFGGYEDPFLVAALHERGIKVFAEVSLFVGVRYWARYPHSRPITSAGEPMAPEGWYCGVNPITPEIRQLKLERIRRLVERYNVDGVWLDFCRWPCRWERPTPTLIQTSFDPLTLEAFQRDQGISIPRQLQTIPEKAGWLLEHHQETWTAWKCQQITAFVQQVRAIIDRGPRKVILGIFSVPWQLSDFEGAIRHIIGQDYQALAAHVDCFSPMVYHKLCGRDIPWIAETCAWAAKETRRPVWPIIQAMDDPKAVSPQELRQVLQRALTAPGSHGVIIFDLKALNPEKLQVMKEVFRGEKKE
jgi:uncharacterized lipoprotein YddW (UPF0748 family)